MERKDALGDRMKAYEEVETSAKFYPNSLVYVRLDGRTFSKFTKGLARPWDDRMSDLMISVTKYLVKEYNALVGYTQSDEISLLIDNSYGSPMAFEGKKQKVISSLAATASSVFTGRIPSYIPEKEGKFPTFDCRAFQVPSSTEAVNAFLWREYDATKNSISMLAQQYFSHKELLGKNGKAKIDMLKTQRDVIWGDCPAYFRYGTYIKKVERKITNPMYPNNPEIRNVVESTEYNLQSLLLPEERLQLIMSKALTADML